MLFSAVQMQKLWSFAMSCLCATNQKTSFRPSTSWYGKAIPSFNFMVFQTACFLASFSWRGQPTFPLPLDADRYFSVLFPLRLLMVQAAILLPPVPPKDYQNQINHLMLLSLSGASRYLVPKSPSLWCKPLSCFLLRFLMVQAAILFPHAPFYGASRHLASSCAAFLWCKPPSCFPLRLLMVQAAILFPPAPPYGASCHLVSSCASSWCKPVSCFLLRLLMVHPPSCFLLCILMVQPCKPPFCFLLSLLMVHPPSCFLLLLIRCKPPSCFLLRLIIVQAAILFPTAPRKVQAAILLPPAPSYGTSRHLVSYCSS